MSGRILINSFRCVVLFSQFVSKSYTFVRSPRCNLLSRPTFRPFTKFTRHQNILFPQSITTVLAASVFQFVKMASQGSTLDDFLKNSDQLFDENQFQEALDILNKYEDQSLADIKWRQARAIYKLSKIDKNKKDELIRKGYELMKEALAINENDFAIHKWMSILLDAKSELEGIKERVSQLENVKKHMVKAVELNPDDATSWHLLGNFAFGLADMPWYQRKIVTAFFATPPTGTYEEALEHFLKAEEKKPNFYSMNLLFIGKCYQRLKNDEKAKEYLTLAANVPVLNEDDKNCKEEATTLLKKY